MPWPRRKLLTLLDVGLIAGGGGPEPPYPPILDGVGVWYRADQGALVAPPTAAQFTAANSEYLSIVHNASLSLGNSPWTVGGWFYLDSLSGTAMLIRKSDLTANVDCQIAVDGGSISSAVQVGGTYPVVTISPSPAIGQWHFVVTWFDPAGGGVLSLQLDNGTPATLVTGAINASANPLYLSHPSPYPLNGRMQHWFMFGRALDSTDRSFLWNAGAGRSFGELSTAFKTNLRAWWPLNETSGARADLSGNANTLSDINTVTSNAGHVAGQDVNIWEDSGPNDFHLTQPTAGNQPVLVSNERNSKAVMRFDGVNDELHTASILGSYLSGVQAQTVFVVQKQLTGNPDSVTYSWDSSGVASNEIGAHLEVSALYHIDGSAITGGFSTATTPLPWRDTWHIVEMVHNGLASSSITIEGNPLTMTAQNPGTLNGAASAPLRVSGRAYNPPTYTFLGDIAELIIFNRVLTTTERDAIRTYLQQKWGIAQNKVVLDNARTGYVRVNTTTNDRVRVN